MAITSQEVLAQNEQELSALRARFSGLASVNIAQNDWRALMESGALATLKVSRYRGVKQLVAADLGLDPTEVAEVESIINLGHRLLLPAPVLAEFNTLETRARQVLRQSGLKTPMGLFVPSRAYDGLASNMATFKDSFNYLVASLLDNLPAHRERMSQEYERLASQVLARLLASDPYSVGYASRDQWQQDFTERCMLHFPSPEQLAGAFSFSLSLSFVPLPYQSQTETPQYAAAGSDLINLRRAVIAEQEQARQSLVQDFLGSVQEELYGLVNESLSDVLASIKKNDSLGSRSIVQLKTVVTQISQLNFWGDRRLETIKEELDALLARPSKTRSAGLASNILEELSYQTRVAAIAIASARSQDDSIVLPQAVTQPLELLAGKTQGLDLTQPKEIKASSWQDVQSGLEDAQARYDALTPAQQEEQDNKTQDILDRLAGSVTPVPAVNKPLAQMSTEEFSQALYKSFEDRGWEVKTTSPAQPLTPAVKPSNNRLF
jgi:hypothetical protein